MTVFSVIRKFRAVLSEHQKFRILELGVMMIAGGLLETCSVTLILPFMNMIMNPDEIMEKWYAEAICNIFNFQSPKALLIAIASFLALIYILKNIYLIAEYNFQYRFVYGNMFAMQCRLHDTFIHRPYESFFNVNSGEAIRIIQSDTNMAFTLLMTLLTLFTEIVVSAMLVIAIFVINPTATICVALLLLVLLAIIYIMVKPTLRSAGIENQKASAGMYKWLLQSIQGIKELKVMQKEEFFQNNYIKYGEMFVTTGRRFSVLNLVPKFLIEAISMAAMFILIAVLIYRGENLENIVPMLTAFAMAAVRLLPSVNRISNAMAQISYSEPMLDKVIENLKTLKTKDKITLKSDDSHVPCLSDVLKFNEITYRYPSTSDNVLTEASMSVGKGESIGIIGASGSGKTTAVDLILGLLCPQHGQVLVDGIDIQENVGEWLGQIGYIPQTIFMLDDTIRANVTFGESERNISDKDVWRALEEAALDEYVHSLPLGLDTEIGEQGIRLSGGQRQRIGIARALYHNPEILIFDEATSALDNETEAAIMESIQNLQGQKTMLIIAHRLSTIESCDHIYRVENGKIILVR